MAKKNRRDFSCEKGCGNLAALNRIKKTMKPENTVVKLAETFRVLGDPTRTKIILALVKRELCVCEISCLLNMSHSAISHQLSVLRHMSLVKFRKDGRTAYYSLDDIHINNLFDEGLRHVEE